MVEVDGRVVADLGEANLEAEVVRELEPGRDVAVVVEPRHDDLVAGLELPADRPREREVERGHVRAEDDLLRAAAEERGAGPARLVDERLGHPARLVGPADVGVRLAQVPRDRVDHLVRHLRAARPVEEDERPVERREAAADGGDVERDGAHGRDASGCLVGACRQLANWTHRPDNRGRAMETETLAPALPTQDGRGQGQVVEAHELTRRYGEGETAVDALVGVDLQVSSGKLTAVMGPSGSGKSTLMHLLAALDRPTSGYVVLAGTKLGQLSDTEITKLRRKHIGFVFQFFNLLPMLTADENIRLPLSIAGEKPDAEWYDNLVKKVGLADRLKHRPAELSGGQQQRVAIARALVSRPTVVFADEPTGNLDSKTGGEILELMRDSVDSYGQTTVMVTHDARAAAIADRILFLADGRIVKDLGKATAHEVTAAMEELDQQ